MDTGIPANPKRGEGLATLWAEQAALAERRDSLLAAIGSHDPEFHAAIRPRPIILADLQASLPDEQTAIVELYEGSLDCLAFVVTREGVEALNLERCPASEISRIAEAWIKTYVKYRKTMGRNDTWPLLADEILETLCETIVSPIRQAIPETIRRLIIIPHFHMHVFPFPRNVS